MIDLNDIHYQPTIYDFKRSIENPLFMQFYQYMNDEYRALCAIEFSKDVWFPGWNIKFKKAGRSLCVLYPKQNYFTLLVVIGKKEKETVEQLLPKLSCEIQSLYEHTKEGMGQRWLMIDLHDANAVYDDVLKLISIRRTSKTWQD